MELLRITTGILEGIQFHIYDLTLSKKSVEKQEFDAYRSKRGGDLIRENERVGKMKRDRDENLDKELQLGDMKRLQRDYV